MTSRDFTIPIRIYWEDTDAGGVVYHANYLRFLERARSDYLRNLGIEQERLRRDNGVVFVLRDVTLRFVKPAKLDDVVNVSAVLTRRRGASLTFQQTIERDGVLLVEATVRAACVGADDFRPRAIPEELFPEDLHP
jgi:acyl-CoA thioester hydrolase